MLKKNVHLEPALRLSSWRKSAIGTWNAGGDPSVYGQLDVDVAPALKYLDSLRESKGVKVTVTHLVARAVAEVFRQHPEINCVLRFWRLYPRKNVDIFFQIAADQKGNDLSGTTIRSCDQKSLVDIAQELTGKASEIRTVGDRSFASLKKLIGRCPSFLVRPLIATSGFILYSLNLWSPLFGVPRDSFGSAMVTSIGSLGLDTAWVPLVPYARIPLLVAVGQVQDRPVVRDGVLSVSKVLRLGVTFDHRYIDGVHASHMVRTLQKVFANPAAFDNK
jgi:pyruvate/2-oxoglutarate dehydrogenase complex dihydrolipoamide acyltransferase (E2) component